MTKAKKNKFGHLAPQYKFLLNPYPHLRFSKCPNCGDRTGQRKVPLLICITTKHFIALNYTNRYCYRCNALIGHKHEIEHLLTEFFKQQDPLVIGSDYIIMGTVEKKGWAEGLYHLQTVDEILPYVHDFKGYEELRMTMAGWFPKDQEPPEMPPAPSKEWVKH